MKQLDTYGVLKMDCLYENMDGVAEIMASSFDFLANLP